MIATSAVVACSSAEHVEGPPPDAGSETALCAAGMPCACGEATCTSDEFCLPGFSATHERTDHCVKFTPNTRCEDSPCAEDQLCVGYKVNNIRGVSCEPRPALGEKCENPNDIDDNPCFPGAFCDSDPGKFDSFCKKSAASGASCETFSKFACPAGETCKSVIYPEFKCSPAAKLGQPCLNSTDCELGLYCTSGDKCALRKGLGSSCDPSRDGALGGECLPSLFCDGGTCREPQPG